MPFLKKIFLLINFLLFHSLLWGQIKPDSLSLQFDLLSVDNGLSQGMVRSILQTKDGLMWFATKDGLNKYDGYNFSVYRNIPGDAFSLQDNYVIKLAEDAQGHIILATASRGLFLFDRKTEHFYPFTIDFNTHTTISDIDYMAIRKEGMLLASNDAFYFIDTFELRKLKPSDKSISLKTTSHYLYPNAYANDKQDITNQGRLTWMKDGSIWVCFQNKALIFKRYTFTKIVKPQELSWPVKHKTNPQSNYIAAMELDGNAHVFLCSDTWFGVYDPIKSTFEFLHSKNANNKYSFYVIPMSDGTFIFNSGQQTVSFNPYTYSIKYVKKTEHFSKLNSKATYIDSNHIVWLGTTGYGVLKIMNGKKLFETFEGKGMHLYRSTANEAVFTKGQDIFQYNPLKDDFDALLPATFYHQYKFQTSFITSPKNNIYWIKGLKEGETWKRLLFKYNRLTKQIQPYSILDQYPRMFESLFMDSRNQIWMIFIGNDHHWKLRKFDESHDSIVSEFSFPVANKLHEYLFVSDWWEDKKHRFWFGTTAGLFCFDEEHKQWHHYKNNLKDSTTLSGDMIFSLCPDPDQPDKYLWIGTNGHGLNRFDMQKGNCYRFDVSHSLPNQIIYGILSDNFHHIWLSTNNGLTCVDVKNFQVRSYNEKDGISGNEFNRYEYQKLQDGRLLFGGVKGYTLFDPQHVLEETIKTNTILTGFLVFNKQIDWKSHPAMITDPIQFARSITLPYNQNMFTIEFASLEYRDASKKYYTYYLDGFNEDWIANGTQHAATFTNLDPGTYTFYTAACDENGKHLSTSASIQIVILTPWWRSWWFISLTIFLIAFLIYSFYRYRLHQATRMLILRNRIASDLHDEIGSTISSISITSSLIQRKLKQTDPGVQSLLLRISQNTNEILEAMSDIVWAINASNDRFTHVFNRMRAFAVENLEPKHIHLDFEVDDTLNLLKLDIMERKNLYLLFKEAIHNIAKYADAKNVQVTIERNGHQKIKMRIADDGKGFDMDSMNEQTLGGNGLSNMQQRAAQLNGELHIESSPGHGTRITLLCPF